MPQHRRLIDNAHPFDLISFAVDLPDTFHHIIDMALGVNSTGNSQSYHFQFGGFESAPDRIPFTEHHAA
jgi:hypothetical protein